MNSFDNNIPPIGLGTYGLTGDAGADAVVAALEIGYRHIDTAQTYDTEKPVGEGIKRSGIERDKLFVTTKITAENYSKLIPSLKRSADDLQLDYLDLTLIHWPAPYDKVPVSDYIDQLAQAQQDGLTKLIGVSNFTRAHVDQAEAVLGKGTLVTNQVECHAYLQNKLLAQHCRDAGIQITAYMPLAQGRLAVDPVLAEIAHNHNAEASQIALAFLLQRECIIIPKSATPARMKSNLAAAKISLSADEMNRIDALDRGMRIIKPEWGPDWD